MTFHRQIARKLAVQPTAKFWERAKYTKNEPQTIFYRNL